MRGTNAVSGKPLSDIAHLRQSIRDILLTPKGSRVMRPEYGSDIFKLVDAPMNSKTLLSIYAATVSALKAWEPRISVTRVYADAAEPGMVSLVIEGKYKPNGEDVKIDGIQVR